MTSVLFPRCHRCLSWVLQGGIVARFIIEDSSMCFINCHLGAGQNKVRTRNADIAGILEEKTMFPMSPESLPFVGGGDGSAVTDHEMVFVSFKLNLNIVHQFILSLRSTVI